jgi:two-component system chemotaxis response regulator CheY
LEKIKEPPEQYPGRRILVVDDDPLIRSTLGQLLTVAGHKVLLAENGLEATRLWREVGADLVILDIFMPEKDGIETIVELRAHSPGLPIIAMSGGNAEQMDLLPEAKLLGAYLTIDKPFAFAKMMALVNSALEDSRRTNA